MDLLGPFCPRCSNPAVDDQGSSCIFCLDYSVDLLSSLSEPDLDPSLADCDVILPQELSAEKRSSRRWSPDAREKHSLACAGKPRLDTQEKIDIIRLYYQSPCSTKGRRSFNQWTIARAYGKSRAAISKILKPDNALQVLSSAEARSLNVTERWAITRSIQEERRRKDEGKALSKQHTDEP
ncbi:hypothetical protein GUITHDRAFT_106505 [Guillardia theta CCMP2712]|uniref:Uncharacterized protein n=1 Tax=Guillardia theta (strain CCMP2712) TaxID=905079 RepID=L1JG72_GUITC|nr:hypothetical protein GUITHDRAFT_106505 [Guillardia theta CCMP2712]EKX47518.1 hypothetical protein GUITHDRAFT_106505 [Guillardia theta CCMP2712]|eukprot:XP_005834498.1 hypothetical protein GUITHDRAFT_106505 [Guillardia theta CCMP2712]